MPTHDHTKAYKNVTPFQPNRGKKIPDKAKTALEQAVSASCAGCCSRCADQVVWKKKYGKFKALGQPRKCNGCAKYTIKAAYHNMCRECARAKGVCPKCQTAPPAPQTGSTQSEAEAAANALADQLARMRERERRAAKRALERGEPLPGRLLGAAGGGGASRGAGGDSDEDGSDFDDSDEEEEGGDVGEGGAGEGAHRPGDGSGAAPQQQPRAGPASEVQPRGGGDDDSSPPSDEDDEEGSDCGSGE